MSIITHDVDHVFTSGQPPKDVGKLFKGVFNISLALIRLKAAYEPSGPLVVSIGDAKDQFQVRKYFQISLTFSPVFLYATCCNDWERILLHQSSPIQESKSFCLRSGVRVQSMVSVRVNCVRCFMCACVCHVRSFRLPLSGGLRRLLPLRDSCSSAPVRCCNANTCPDRLNLFFHVVISASGLSALIRFCM